MWRLLKWIAGTLIVAGLLYLSSALILARVPGQALSPKGELSYQFYACDNGVHVDLVLPAAGAGRDWFAIFPPQDFAGDVAGAGFVALGWGARSFYAETREWKDIRPVPVLLALFWLDSAVLHVSYAGDPAGRENCRPVVTDAVGRDALYAHIDATLGGKARRESLPGYGAQDAFYRAEGRYSLFRTCNIWTLEGLQAAGQRMALWAPFSFQIMGLLSLD